MGKTSSLPEKRRTEPSRGLKTQFKKDLECILGCCNHPYTSKTCVYWTKIVDSADPARAQHARIVKLIQKHLGVKL